MNSQMEKAGERGQEAVAVVIPVRNRPDLLERCLDSLTSQEFPIDACEVLVCDDGSDSDLRPVVSKFKTLITRIRLLRQEAKGPAAARNLGLRSSAADLFVCIDSDIICGPRFLAEIIYALNRNYNWVGAEATVLAIRDGLSPLKDAPEGKGGVFISGASGYRATALRKTGGFDEAFLLPACEDVDLGMKLSKLGKFGYVHEAVVYHSTRQVTLGTHWRWRKHWKYEMILAKRYGILSFPGKSIGHFPRLRVMIAAVITLPAGRFLEGIRYIRRSPSDGVWACLYAIFDVFCGLWAMPTILFSRVPPLRDYLSNDGGR
jgi:GT2 family glycosyltransferase